VSYAGQEEWLEAYVQALCSELSMLPPASRLYATPTLRPSLFFGGGTPSLLHPAQVERVLDAAAQLVPLDGAEITMEANPGTLMGAAGHERDALSYLRDLRASGINRLSMGVQSLHNPTLHTLGRIHTAEEAARSFADARRAGFTNLGVDMIYGLPGQTSEQWASDLQTLLTWNPDHVSLYSLILEPETPLYAQVMMGSGNTLPCLPDEDATASMYEHAMQQLAQAGYQHYEISNWAKQDDAVGNVRAESHAKAQRTQRSGQEHGTAAVCQHNLAYWYNDDYLAAGAGAHGHIYPQRYANVSEIAQYIRLVQQGQRPLAEVIPLTIDDLCAETMFMGLRLHAGVERDHFHARCGVAMERVYGERLTRLAEQGLIVSTDSAVRLTAHGRMFGNRVFAEFV